MTALIVCILNVRYCAIARLHDQYARISVNKKCRACIRKKLFAADCNDDYIGIQTMLTTVMIGLCFGH